MKQNLKNKQPTSQSKQKVSTLYTVNKSKQKVNAADKINKVKKSKQSKQVGLSNSLYKKSRNFLKFENFRKQVFVKFSLFLR